MKRWKKIIIAALLVLFIIIAFYSMSGILTPYVSVKSAMETGNYVQIIGRVTPGSPEQHEGFFTFSLEDKEGSGMNIIYRGVKPLNFEHADKIVVLGSYKSSDKIFEADKLLVKCPSKYTKSKE